MSTLYQFLHVFCLVLYMAAIICSWNCYCHHFIPYRLCYYILDRVQIVVNINIVYFVDAFETGMLLAREKTISPNKRKSDKGLFVGICPLKLCEQCILFINLYLVLKKVVKVTVEVEEFKQLRDEAMRMNEPAFSHSIHNNWSVFNPMHYLVEGIRHFTDVNPKDTEARDNITLPACIL